jgi:hypothetical protein
MDQREILFAPRKERGRPGNPLTQTIRDGVIERVSIRVFHANTNPTAGLGPKLETFKQKRGFIPRKRFV